MKTTFLKKALSPVLCTVLIAATALGMTGCGKTQTPQGPLLYSEDCTLGEGETQFALTVADAEGEELVFTVRTDAETVGEALLEVGLIEGEEGDYGLFIKSVNGLTADYDTTGTYWAFYVNGAYAMGGVDTTPIEPDTDYALRVEQA